MRYIIGFCLIAVGGPLTALFGPLFAPLMGAGLILFLTFPSLENFASYVIPDFRDARILQTAYNQAQTPDT